MSRSSMFNVAVLIAAVFVPCVVALRQLPTAPIGNCGTPSQFTLMWANVDGTTNSAPHEWALSSSASISSSLVANGIVNLTLSAVPSYTDGSFAPTAGEYGLLLAVLSDSIVYNVSSYNPTAYSASVFTPTAHMYVPGTSATSPTSPYGFNHVFSWTTQLYPQFFVNGNTASRGYLGTIGITTTSTTQGGGSCLSANYYVALWNPTVSGLSVGGTPTSFGGGDPPQPVSIAGDPQFTGLRGQSFQIHGIDGAVYNIISDNDAQVNARFVFLNGPRLCPLIPSTGKRAFACWSHAGSFLGQVGVKNERGDQLLIESGPAKSGFATVSLNGESLVIGDVCDFANQTSTHEVTVRVGAFVIELENSDHFINLRSVRTLRSRIRSHGLLGQTWSTKSHKGKVKEIEGEVDDYLVTEDCLFGDSFLFNQYKLAKPTTTR